MKAIILKIRELATGKPALVVFSLGLAITLAIGVTIGMLGHHQAFAVPDDVFRGGG